MSEPPIYPAPGRSREAPDERVTGDGALRRRAYDRIEDLLNSGRLAPGQLISQRELVALTGATLGSVREAVPRFEAEGLLLTVPKKGLMVPGLDVTFVREAYQVRAMIEHTAVPDMIRKLDDATIQGFLGSQKALQEELLNAGQDVSADLLDRIQRADWNMHAAFVAAMGNALIDNIYRVNAIKIRMVAQSRLKVTGTNAARIMGEHFKVLSALAARDRAATERALSLHLNNSLQIALGGEAAPFE